MDIQVEQQRPHGVRHPYGIATLRVDQNRVVLTEARKTEAGNAFFKKCWTCWKCACVSSSDAWQSYFWDAKKNRLGRVIDVQ